MFDQSFVCLLGRNNFKQCFGFILNRSVGRGQVSINACYYLWCIFPFRDKSLLVFIGSLFEKTHGYVRGDRGSWISYSNGRQSTFYYKMVGTVADTLCPQNVSNLLESLLVVNP